MLCGRALVRMGDYKYGGIIEFELEKTVFITELALACYP
jgi:hypothetical protein